MIAVPVIFGVGPIHVKVQFGLVNRAASEWIFGAA
jgi:hypothetical protein